MDRRKFLKMLLFGSIFSLFTKKVKAENKTGDKKLKEAMFWRRVD